MRNLLLALVSCGFLSTGTYGDECVPSEWGPNDEIGLPMDYARANARGG